MSQVIQIREDERLRLCKSGLAERPGRIRCLSCNRWFASPNTIYVRRCKQCKVNEPDYGNPHTCPSRSILRSIVLDLGAIHRAKGVQR